MYRCTLVHLIDGMPKHCCLRTTSLGKVCTQLSVNGTVPGKFPSTSVKRMHTLFHSKWCERIGELPLDIPWITYSNLHKQHIRYASSVTWFILLVFYDVNSDTSLKTSAVTSGTRKHIICRDWSCYLHTITIYYCCNAWWEEQCTWQLITNDVIYNSFACFGKKLQKQKISVWMQL